MIPNWNLADRLHPQDLFRLIRDQSRRSLPERRLAQRCITPIRNADSILPLNFEITETGTCGLLRQDADYFWDELQRFAVREWSSFDHMLPYAAWEQSQALKLVFEAFFALEETDFGWVSLVPVRYTKEARADHEDHEIQHTFLVDRTETVAIQHEKARMFRGFELPLQEFHWKSSCRGGTLSRQGKPEIFWAGCVNQITHARFLPQGSRLVENRHAIARSPLEKRMLRCGKIPMLDLEEDCPLRTAGLRHTMLLSLNRIAMRCTVYPSGNEVIMAQNFTLEFDPRTLELISTRSYHEPLDVCVLNSTAFDHCQLSLSICEYFA